MEYRNDKNQTTEEYEHREIFSKAVRAGKRTYFFDVKATRRNDFFLSVTESKKLFHKDGRFYFEKHKIHLYKEDFEKFTEGFHEVLEFIKTIEPSDHLAKDGNKEGVSTDEYTRVEFEDLKS